MKLPAYLSNIKVGDGRYISPVMNHSITFGTSTCVRGMREMRRSSSF